MIKAKEDIFHLGSKLSLNLDEALIYCPIATREGN